MAFTASVIPDTLVRADNIFMGEAAYKAERSFPTPLLTEMTRRQSASIKRFFDDEQKCVAIDAWFAEIGAHTTPAAIPDPEAQGCDLITGPETGTRKATYANGRIGFATGKITGPKCNNALEMQEEMATLLLKMQSDIRKQVQKQYYDLFTGNSQGNIGDPDLDDRFGDATSGGNRLASAAENWDFEFLRAIELLADDNYFPEDRLIVSGQNLYLDKDLAMYRALNDDQRDQRAIFDDSTMIWDTRTMDKYLGRKSTFVVNPHNFVFNNVSWYSAAGQDIIVDGKQRTEFSVPDRSGWQFQGAGGLETVRYHVEVEHVCTGRNVLGSRIDEITINMSLIGLNEIGPVGYTNPVLLTDAPTVAVTGVLEVVKETPAV